MHTLRVLHQKVQQFELRGAHLEGLSLVSHAVGGRVQHQLTNRHTVVDLLRRTAAQHGANAGKQFLRRERLGDVVVRTRIEPSHFVGFIAARGEHQDGNGLETAVSTPLAGQLQPALAGQHPVQQDDVGQHGVQLALGRFAIF